MSWVDDVGTNRGHHLYPMDCDITMSSPVPSTTGPIGPGYTEAYDVPSERPVAKYNVRTILKPVREA